MALHAQHQNKLPDSDFDKGTFYHIVPGNSGRVLDGRRTPGFIEHYDSEVAMFTWRITDFEDKGRCWQIPAENIVQYQFEKQAVKLNDAAVKAIENKCRQFSEKLVISGRQTECDRTLALISREAQKLEAWFLKESQFVNNGHAKLDFKAQVGCEYLFNDLTMYMKRCGLCELEEKTANQYILNPHSGEWIKGLKIVMAELGLIDFDEKRPRTKDIFMGIGSRALRKQYIIARLAFVQTFFKLAHYREVPLFRGVVTESKNYQTPKTLLSTTFNADVAKAFSSLEDNDKVAFSYFVKFSYPIENLFMTFFETKSFNERYLEQEAIVLYRDRLFF